MDDDRLDVGGRAPSPSLWPIDRQRDASGAQGLETDAKTGEKSRGFKKQHRERQQQIGQLEAPETDKQTDTKCATEPHASI